MRAGDDGLRQGRTDPLSGVPDAVYHLDRDRVLTYVNTAGEAMMGCSASEMLQRPFFATFPGLRGTTVEKTFGAVLADGRPRVFEYLHERWDHWFEMRAYPDSRGLTVIVRDVDDRVRSDLRRDDETRQLTAVMEALPSATVLIDGDGRILTANRAWVANGELLRTNGIDAGGVGDHYLTSMARGLRRSDHAAIVAGVSRLQAEPVDGPAGSFDYDYSAQLGSAASWFRLQAARVEGSPRIVVAHTDVTDQVRDEQVLAWKAGHDELTGLPNRSTLLELTGAALASGPPDGPGTALLVIDLDGFKTVNDSLGHEIGDSLLNQVGSRLADQVRPGDAVGRLGADQFLVLARDCDSSEAASLAFRLQTTFRLPFATSGISVPLTASIGVAVSRPDVTDPHQLLSDADAAMFAAKGSGRDRVHLFSPGLREAARWRLEVATRLRGDAIDQLVVHYQPVVRLDTGEVEGVEALVRWQHPERGLLPPDTFLSVAEETGQVIPITRWLLRETTRKAAEWAAQGLPLRMSVNVSARHFSAETLVRDVRVALRDSGLPPDQLILELTETCVAEDPTRAEDQLAVLRSFGVRVAIDDFGTGWSSLAQLFALPIGTLKIDRSLLNAAEQAVAGETGAVLSAIVGLTRTLGIRSVAEGVETPEHLRMVREAGCDLAQGWLLGHAMPADEVPGWVRSVQAAGGDLCALALARCAVAQAG
ncbi:EAL domain-containing protein [Blastococcus sp. CT_GayMR16]|uniref:putative bifunctional diguanylate cyclase/phosphodiesterase n=1 Tax=Blastococcus sp. CT_GayMR16 TaxID=2559607 RepID=UPI001FD8069C|nr:EAL domain-containing protein [Blastococcus sp. CT_GayMR16]